MEKYSQLPERTVPSSGRVKVHACKLYVTRTWMRSFSNSALWSGEMMLWVHHWGRRGRRAGKCSGLLSHWSHPALELTQQLLWCPGHCCTYRASLENIAGQERVGPPQAASWYRTQLHGLQIVLQKKLSSQVLHNFPLLPRQWQRTQNSASHTAGETAATETSVVKKKYPQSLYQESSQKAGGELSSQCSQKHSPAPAGTSVPWLFIWYKLASFFWSGSALNITAGQCLLSFQIGLNIFKKDLGSAYCLRQLLVNSSCLLLFPRGNASEL